MVAKGSAKSGAKGTCYLDPRTPGTVVRPLVAADLFSGAGGITLGLLSAGIDVRFCADINQSCSTTHKRNFPDISFYLGDIRNLDPKLILDACQTVPGELNILMGGPPCQGFSIIGGRDISDPRNGLFHDFIRIAKALQPKAIIIENVPGLATLHNGEILSKIGSILDECGYNTGCAELLAAQYGVPQMRWRLVVIGWRRDLGISAGGFPTPSHGCLSIGELVPNKTISPCHSDGFLTAADAISDLPAIKSGETGKNYLSSPTGIYQQEMRRGLTNELYNHYAPKMSEINIRRINALKPGQDWRDLPYELLPDGMKRALRKDHTRRFRRMRWDTVPRSIITRFRDPKSGEYIHPDQTRTISIREAARIQSFPDWFIFTGPNTDQYDQVGNAVPPLLAKAIGAEVAKVLMGESSNTKHWPKCRYSFHTSFQAGLFSNSCEELAA